MICLIADAHLGKCLRDADAEFQTDSFLAFERAIDHVVASGAKALVLAGDTTDKNHASGAAIDVLRAGMDRLREAGIQAYFVEGNHDRQVKWHKRSVPILEALGAEHLDGRLVEVDGIRLYGLDYRPSTSLPEALAAVPPCDILVMHQAFRHLLGFEGASDLSDEDIPTHVANVFVGDVHKRDMSLLPNGGVIVSPGPLHPCDQGQCDDAGFVVSASKTSRGSVQFEDAHIGTRLIIRRDVPDGVEPGSDELQLMVAELDDEVACHDGQASMNGWHLPRPVLSLRVKEGGEAAAAALSKHFIDACNGIVWSNRSSDSVDQAFEPASPAADSHEAMTLAEAVPHVADPEDRDVAELAIELLEAENVTQALASWVASRMAA
jgi:DNA repair exonuclease SbcCD nuclease subunit